MVDRSAWNANVKMLVIASAVCLFCKYSGRIYVCMLDIFVTSAEAVRPSATGLMSDSGRRGPSWVVEDPLG